MTEPKDSICKYLQENLNLLHHHLIKEIHYGSKKV